MSGGVAKSLRSTNDRSRVASDSASNLQSLVNMPIVRWLPMFGDDRRPHPHSMTSSARASISGGIVSPRALAVFRLMSNKNFVGCSIGRSAGLAPFRILST